MSKHVWYRYKDFATGKVHKTRGMFDGWMTDGLGIRRATFRGLTTDLYVPEYCLTAEAKAIIGNVEKPD